MDLSLADIRALSMRFTTTYANDIFLYHCLPNSLIVITFNPEYAKSIHSLSFAPDIAIGKTVTIDHPFVVVNGNPISSQVTGNLLDVNSNLQESIPRFSAGPTASFLIIIKPTGTKDKYEPIKQFKKLY